MIMNGSIIRSKEDPNCYRMDENGWIFVHVEGSAAVRGFNYGYLLTDEIIQADHSQQCYGP